MSRELAPDPSGEWPSLVSELETTLARVVTWAATLFFACVVVWEIGAPLVAGHYASSASMGIIADNMRRWGIVAPVWLYTADPPDPSLYYCHHPFGIFWTTTALQSVFGRSDVTCRLAPALLSIATVPLLSALGRALYRPLAGALMAAVFVSLPISLAFAQFNALEVPVIAWSTLFLWGWVRSRSTGARRHVAAMLVGATLAVHADWPAFVLVGLVLALDLAALVFGPRRPDRALVAGWALLATMTVSSGLLYIGLFSRYGMLDDLFASYELRRGAEEITLRQLYEGRSAWDEWMLTRAFFVLAPLGALAALDQSVRLRRGVLLAPVFVLVMAAFQYGVFRQGAWIHVFWPHYFALGLALAVGALVAAAAPFAARLAERAPRLRGRGHVLVLGAGVLLAIVILRDGLDMLVWARRTGGRFDERGLFIETDADEITLLRALAAELPPEAEVGLHESIGATWAHTWALGGRVVHTEAPLPFEEGTAVAATVVDLRGLRPRAIDRLVACCSLRVVGHLAVVKRGPLGITSEAFAEREPAFHERVVGPAFEPVRTIRPSAFPGWLVAAHHGGATHELLDAASTAPELAVAYDAALAAGQPARADEIRRELDGRLSGSPVVYDDETRLLGFELVRGASPRLILVFSAGGPLPDRVSPRVRARVLEGPSLSLARQPQGATRELGPKWLIAPSRWKPSWLYTATVDLLPRPGSEAYEISIESDGRAPAPRAVGAGEWVEIYRE